jgi:hypothetical protein
MSSALSCSHQVLHIQAKHQPPADLQPLPPQAVATSCSILCLQDSSNKMV